MFHPIFIQKWNGLHCNVHFERAAVYWLHSSCVVPWGQHPIDQAKAPVTAGSYHPRNTLGFFVVMFLSCFFVFFFFANWQYCLVLLELLIIGKVTISKLWDHCGKWFREILFFLPKRETTNPLMFFFLNKKIAALGFMMSFFGLCVF